MNDQSNSIVSNHQDITTNRPSTPRNKVIGTRLPPSISVLDQKPLLPEESSNSRLIVRYRATTTTSIKGSFAFPPRRPPPASPICHNSGYIMNRSAVTRHRRHTLNCHQRLETFNRFLLSLQDLTRRNPCDSWIVKQEVNQPKTLPLQDVRPASLMLRNAGLEQGVRDLCIGTLPPETFGPSEVDRKNDKAQEHRIDCDCDVCYYEREMNCEDDFGRY